MTLPSPKFTFEMRTLHWMRAALVLGVLAVGLLMVNAPGDIAGRYELLYPNHKQFGLLVPMFAAVQLLLRTLRPVPALPHSFKPWERHLAHTGHVMLYVLMMVVPVMGYCMSSSFSQSDGVPFFFTEMPELLAKNDALFVWFQWLHRWLAYALLALIALHVMAVIKHRFFDKNPEADILPRML